MPKKRRVWKKIELIETSAVGTPSYPDAHLSYSFTKALHTQLNLKETEMAEEENTQTEAQAQESGAPASTVPRIFRGLLFRVSWFWLRYRWRILCFIMLNSH